jgi:hypothetical protein
MPLSELQTIIETYQELQRLHQLNTELLEQLNVAVSYFVDNDILLPNREILSSLFVKSQTILNEIQADTPKILMYKKLSDASYHEPQNRRKVTRTLFLVL